MQACMQLGLSIARLQMAHNILLPTLGNSPILASSFFAFTFKNTCSPTLNSLYVLFLYVYLFSLSHTTFKLCLIFTKSSSISLRNYTSITALFVGLSHLTGVLHFLPYKASNDLIFDDAWYTLL
jgi:hypothetical protein